MKKILLIIITFLVAISIHAREPYGDYICRYIVTSPNSYHAIYNPIKITHYGIRVKNTNAGTKTWVTRYQGTFSYIYGTYRDKKIKMHNFYLTNQHVEFSISDAPIIPYNGKNYYLINFDGQWQLAEPYY